jgi:hypothetical protein
LLLLSQALPPTLIVSGYLLEDASAFLVFFFFDEGSDHPNHRAAVSVIKQLSDFLAAKFDVQEIGAA